MLKVPPVIVQAITRPLGVARRHYRYAICAIVLAPIIAVGAFQAAVKWWPYPNDIDAAPPPFVLVEDHDGRELAAFVSTDQQWNFPLSSDEISPHLLDAIVAVEDSRFYEHHGVDWKSAGYAAWVDLRSLHIQRGASTLTMQLHRLRDPRPRTFFNKFKQAIRASQIEQRQSKQQILVEYVNRAPFGGNLVGAGAASWRYFNRPCKDLSLAEVALLAGLPQSPNRLRPDRYPQRALARRNHVLDRMRELGMIDQKQHDDACKEPIVATWRPLPQYRENRAAPADGALPTLLRLANDSHKQTLVTTLDAAVQHDVFVAARDQLEMLQSSGVSAAAVVVLETPTSKCLAAASLSRTADAVDLTTRPRSTGSTLKPFIYAAAFDDCTCTPQTILQDSPAAWAGYQPVDYDHKFRGSITAADALAESRNIPAMRVLADVGVERAVGVMDWAGLRTLARSPQRYGLSLAIGGAEATPMELAQAYAVLGRGGVMKEVQMIDEPTRNSTTHPGNLSAASCWQTLVALSAPDRTASIYPAALKTHVAWKTGTSNGHRDAWCAAVTRKHTVVVWLGNAGGEGSPALVGAEAAAPLALQLIASLDSSAMEDWPVVPSQPVKAHRSALSAATLALVSPRPDQRFIIDHAASADHQRVLLKATLHGEAAVTGRDSRTLYWFVDGRPIGVGEAGAQLWWTPINGRHEVRVIDARGHAAAAAISVDGE